MNLAPLSWPTYNPRAREEWDFRALGKKGWYAPAQYGPYDLLSDDEVLYCHIYEFYRLDPDADTLLEKRQQLKPWKTWQASIDKQPQLTKSERDSLRATTFDALLDHHLKKSPDRAVIRDWFCIPWPEWPNEPYLSIPRLERQRRFSASWKDNVPRVLPLVDLKKICADVQDLNAGKVPSRLRYWQPSYKLTLNDDTWIYSRTPDKNAKRAPTEIVAFEIDFNLPNKRLAKLFGAWIDSRREAKGYREQETRGPASATDRMRKELLALGAGRLIQSGMTYNQAIDYTTKLTGKPLYADQAAWSRAVHRAEPWLGKV